MGFLHTWSVTEQQICTEQIKNIFLLIFIWLIFLHLQRKVINCTTVITSLIPVAV